MNAIKLIEELYKNVDRKNINYLEDILADDVEFRIGNNEIILGRQAALEANRGFFGSIAAMSHKIDDIWSEQDDIICKGQANYTRLDGSKFSVPFATFLKVHGDKITNYLVYADVSEL